MRLIAFMLAAVAVSTALASAPARASSSQTLISGGGISQPIRFTPVDEDAFFRRINVPPKLDVPPAVSGASYTLKTPYWPIVLPGNGKDRPAALEEAAYYPDGGFVRTSQGGRDVWLGLDVRQRAIIDRYIRLGEKHLLLTEPSMLDVLRAEAATGGTVGISVGTNELNTAESARLWTAAEDVNPRSFPLPASAAGASTPETTPDNGAWLIFTLPEGRDARLLYLDGPDILIDYTAQQYYPVPRSWLANFQAGQAAEGASAQTEVPNEKGPGSPAWWVVMIGGGAALLGAAVLMRRRFNRT